MNRRLRITALAATALSAGLLMSACQGKDTGAMSGGASDTASSSTVTPSGSSTDGGSAATPSASASSSSSSSGGTSKASGGSGSTSKSGTGDKKGYGQGCGANDISWSTKSKTQAGGYILIIAKAKPGITCQLPGGLPTVAFGSDGTEATNAEQVAGDPITLHAGVTAYAGVNPKTTKDNYGKELYEIIVAVGDKDPNPVSLKVGKIVVDKPIVTDWHTDPSKAVPGDGGTDE